MLTEEESARWGARALELAEQAVSEIADGTDAIATLSHAIACLRVEANELDPAEVEQTPEPSCICPPGLKARGGFTSICPACNP